MTTVLYKSADRTVNNIAERNSIQHKIDHMVVTVLDSIADIDAGAGVATYRFNKTLDSWILISKSNSEYADKVHTHTTSQVTGLDDALDNKVDKELGKGLSTNDYSDAEKSKLDGIALEATKNRADSENADKVHTHSINQVTGLDTALDSKVDKELGKGLSDENYTLTEKDKLSDIETGSTKNATDAQLRNRTTHTGVQPISTVSGLQSGLDSKADTTYVDTQLDTKVDKVVGKGLSTEDFTTAEKDKLAVLNNFDDSAIQAEIDTKVDKVAGKQLSDKNYTLVEKNKLSGIQVGATANDTDAQLRNRTTHTGVQPISTVEGLQGSLDDKVDKETGKSLISSTELQKLSGIEAGAQVNLISVDNLISDSKTRPLSANQGTILKNLIDNINTLLQSDDTTLDELQEIVDFIKLNREELDSLGISSIAGLEDALSGKQPLNSILTRTTESFTSALKTKLDAIATQATKNATDAQLRNRATHTGVQSISTIDGLQTSLDGKANVDDIPVLVSELENDSNYLTEDSISAWAKEPIKPSYTKGEVGLGNVDNTSDLSKPISTATQGALDSKTNTSTQIIAGTGLSGGGALSANRTLNVTYGTTAGTVTQGNDSRLSNSREWTGATISQAEAEEGTVTTRRAFTAQRVRQAILGWWSGSAEKAKLDGIQAGAQVNVATDLGSSGTGATRTITSSTGSNTSITYSATDVGAVPSARSITAGTGLSGGGNLTANRTFSVNYGTAAGTAAQGNDSRLSNSREWTASTVSQAEAETGTATTARKWTSQRVRQAILGWWNSSTSKTKLDGIATGATKNATDAQLRDRSTHTGTQAVSTVSGLQTALDAKAASAHTHSWSQVTGQPATANRWPTFGEVSDKPTNYPTTWASVAAKPAQATRWPTWTEVTSKPSTFTPSSHTHPSSQITGLGTAATKDVGTAFGNVMQVGSFGVGTLNHVPWPTSSLNDPVPSGTYYAQTSKGFPFAPDGMVEVFNYSSVWVAMTAYDLRTGKTMRRSKNNGTWSAWVDLLHTGNTLNTTGTSTDFPMSQKAVTDALAAKAASSHAHPISQVTGLQAALNGKAASSHTHAYLPVNGKATDSDKLGGLGLNTTTTNSQANKVVRTDPSGYLNTGWINTTSGNTTSTITDIYVNTNDGYIRKATKAHFANQMSGYFAPLAHTHNYAATNHTHTAAQVGQSLTGLSAGAVGSHAYLRLSAARSSISFGSTYAGSGLRTSGNNVKLSSDGNEFGVGGGAAVSGTWRALGACSNSRSDRWATTLFVRIS